MQVVSKLHKLRELTEGDSLQVYAPDDRDMAEGMLDWVLDHMQMIHRENTPLYFMHEDVMNMASEETARDSIRALVKMGLAGHLPFPELIVEYAVPPSGTIFLLVREYGAHIPLSSRQYDILTGKEMQTPITDLTATFTAVFVRLDATGVAVSVIHAIDTTGKNSPNLVTFPLVSIPDKDGGDAKTAEITVFMIKTAVKALLLALSTDGIGQQKVPAPVKLNKARAKHGKPAVPAVTVLHLSHYRDSAGRSHSIATGRHVRLHLRAGHIRNQACGVDRKDHKQIFIRPVIVNYRPDQPVPAPVRDVRP